MMTETSKGGGGFVMDFSSFPRFAGRDPWPTTRAPADRISCDQSTTAAGKFLPHLWQNEPENPPSNLFLQGSTIPPGECFAGVSSDSSGALSLLSNQPWCPRDRPSCLGINNFLNTGGTSVNHFSITSWGFKGNEAGSSSHEMMPPPDLGLRQISQPGGNQYHTGELESETHQGGRQYIMEFEHSRANYDSSAQHSNWSL
ncbi:Squamosa promoter-binding-like protein [Sarracenia purpurea var. burkii]